MTERTPNDAMSDLNNDLVTRFEEKDNKINDVSGDHSNDFASFPTVQAMKSEDNKKVDKAQAVANNFVITNNAKNIDLANKIGNIDVTGAIGSTSGLLVVTDNSGVLNTSGTIIRIGEKATPNNGALKSYQLLLNNNAISGSLDIDVPNFADMFLQSASIETVSATPTADETEDGLVAGDKYLKLVVNTGNTETGATILRVNLTPFLTIIFTADEVSLTKSASNVFSIKDGGVSTVKIADGAVTEAKLDSAFKNSLMTEAEFVDAVDYLRGLINPQTP